MSDLGFHGAPPPPQRSFHYVSAAGFPVQANLISLGNSSILCILINDGQDTLIVFELQAFWLTKRRVRHSIPIRSLQTGVDDADTQSA